jgi:hypothetical protein
MTATINRSIGALAIAAILALVTFLAPATARSQCTAYTITNNTACTVNITFYSGASLHTIFGITPGTANYPAPPFVPAGIVTARGNFVTLPAACTGCITLRRTGSTTFCCATLCSPTACSFIINPVACSATCL